MISCLKDLGHEWIVEMFKKISKQNGGIKNKMKWKDGGMELWTEKFCSEP